MKVTVYVFIYFSCLLFSEVFGQNKNLSTIVEHRILNILQVPQSLNNVLNWKWEPQPRWLSGVDWGGMTFNGGVDYGGNFFGSTLTKDQYVDVEIRFNSGESTHAATYRRDLSYAFGGIGTFPGSAWDISNPDSPRRLNICLAEDDATKAANLLWDPDTSNTGGREYIYVMNSDYDGSGTTYNDTNDGTSADVLYAMWPRLRPGFEGFAEDPARLKILIRSDSLALVKLYNTTDGANWFTNTNWKQGNVESWYGVTLGDGRVTELDLRTNNLSGPLPTEFGDLQGLKAVDLNKNNLTGNIPDEIGTLLHLEDLGLAENNFNGGLPDSLWNLESLKYLSLAQNDLDGTLSYKIVYLQKLRELNLSNNNLSGSIPSEITFLDSLELIYIINNQFRDLPDLSGMDSLQTLYVYGNQLTFEDLEPNISIPEFEYSPQQNIGEIIDTTLTEGSSITLTAIISGSNNSFQWYRNNIIITGATEKNYTLSAITMADTGSYQCRITNSIVTGLSIFTNPAKIRVYSSAEYDLVTIRDIQYVTDAAAQDSSSLLGDTVRVRGLVLTYPDDLAIADHVQGIYIVDPDHQQEPWNGLRVSQTDTIVLSTDFHTLEPGMLCEFTGFVREYNRRTGLRILVNPPAKVTVLSSGNPFPEPIQLNCDSLDDRATAEKWESMWVQISDVTVSENNLEGNLASVSDNTGAVTYLGGYFKWFSTKLSAGTYSWPAPGSELTAKGFINDQSSPIGEIFSLNPRTETDIEVVPQDLSVQVLAPNGGESWNEDLVHNIRWAASSTATTIIIQYSTDNGQTYVSIDTTDNDGIRGWRIPRTPSDECKIKILASDTDGNTVSDESDDVFSIIQVQSFTHQTGTLNQTIRNDGWSGQIFANDPGMEYPAGSGNNHLYGNQLFVSTVYSNDTIACRIFKDNYLPTQPLNYIDHGSYVTTNTFYSDKLGLGIQVEQKTYGADSKSYIIYSYQISNQSSQSYSDFYIASFADFDVYEYSTNRCGYDNANNLAYMWDDTGNWTSYAGMSSLDQTPYAFRRWSYDQDQLEPRFIYRKMSEAGFDDTSTDPANDYRFLMSLGPYNLSPGASIDVAFVILAADGLDQLKLVSQDALTVWLDDEAPTISSVGVDPSTAQAGQSITISTAVSDNNEIQNVTLHYRTGGSAAFSAVEMTYTAGVYQATIPASYVTEQGVEFYISAQDITGNSNSSSRYMPQISIAANGLASTTISGGTADNAYRMISAPLEFSDASVQNVLDEFGEYDDKYWRLFHDSGSIRQEYNEFQQIDAGKAYWLITRNTRTINFPAGTTIPVTDHYQINLAPGWTQVGLPFNYTVAWSDIMNTSGQPSNIDGPYLYQGSYSMPTDLEAFEGYYVYNGGTSTIQLQIPTKGAGAAADKIRIDQGWQAKIIARQGQAYDDLNIIGAHPMAAAGKDPDDHLEPPPIGNYISLYFPHPDWPQCAGNYATDIRPESGEGYVWDMEIQSNIENKPIELSFDELGQINLPPGFNCILVDPDVKTGQDLLKYRSYSIPAIDITRTKSLRLIIGKTSFVQKHNLGMSVVPTMYELKQNYPNPFNPVTRITFGLPKNTQLSLHIYNVLGERICTLIDNLIFEAGYHSINWDGRDSSGNRIASGIYLYQLHSREFTETHKMIFVR